MMYNHPNSDNEIIDTNYSDCSDAPGCRVISSSLSNDVSNIPCFPQTAKIPVVLAEPTMIIPVECSIKLECPAIEIKRVRKDVYIGQSKLLPTNHRCTFKFFISGFIRQNIEYATVNNFNFQAVCGSIRHTTVKIPYSASTDIVFPACGPFPLFTRTEESFAEFLDACGTGPRIEKKLFTSNVFYNEQPYSELVCANFNEYDIGECCRPMECGMENTFEVIEEHIIMNLRIKILQLQQIPLPMMSGGCGESCQRNCCDCGIVGDNICES